MRRATAIVIGLIVPACGRLGFDLVGGPAIDAASDGSSAAPLTVQSTFATLGGATSADATFSAASRSGNVIAVAFSWDGPATIVDVTDSAGNSYVLVGSTLSALGSNCQLAYASNIGSGVTPITVTAHISASSTGLSLLLHDISGVNASAPFVSSNAQFQPADPTLDALSSGALTVSGNNNYIFGASFNITGNDAVFSHGTGFMQVLSGNRGSAPFMSESGIQNQPATFTGSVMVGFGDYMTLGMVFEP